MCMCAGLQLEISKEGEGKDDDQGKAYSALAAAYQKLGDAPKAVESLERFLRIAQDSENYPQQAEACTNLGVVHSRAHNFTESIKYFEQAYELSRSMLASGQGTFTALACGFVHTAAVCVDGPSAARDNPRIVAIFVAGSTLGPVAHCLLVACALCRQARGR